MRRRKRSQLSLLSHLSLQEIPEEEGSIHYLRVIDHLLYLSRFWLLKTLKSLVVSLFFVGQLRIVDEEGGSQAAGKMVKMMVRQESSQH